MAVYGVKSKSEILMSVLNSLEKNANITAIYPGSIARAFADAFSSEVSDLYEAMRYTISQTNLMTASGRALDLIGDLYGIPRKSVTDFVAQERETYNIEFTIQKPHSVNITIPSKTLVYNDVSNFITKQYSYELVGDVIIPTGSLRAYGIVRPNFTDNSHVAAVNTLTKHNFIAPPTVLVFSRNPKEVYSNISAESDSSYRRRIMASMKSRVAGTAESVRFAALSVKGVRDVRIRQASYGIGSCDVIVVPEVSSVVKALPEAILTAINEVKPVGVKFNIRIAEKVSISISAILTIPQGNSDAVISGILNQADLFTRRYLNSLSIGDPVSISEIERQMKLSSDIIRGVTFTSFSADGRDLPLKDFSSNSVREYFCAGNISLSSVIIGSGSY
jgi:uncharacterized phage protein gp47/JayE